MEDQFTPFEIGLSKLLKCLEVTSPTYSDVLVFQQRLLENINQAKRYGDTENLRHDRSQIVENLNNIAIQACGRSFNSLCGFLDVSGTKAYLAHGYSLPRCWADRESEINQLRNEITLNQHAVISVVAIGGAGKSTLVYKVFEALTKTNEYDRVFWFSFYVETSVERFLEEACTFFIPNFDKTASQSSYSRAAKLRTALSQQKCLLVLDGFEILLVDNLNSPSHGTVEDLILRNFLRGMCEQNSSQIIITSRLSLTDFQTEKGYCEIHLPDLSSISASSYMLKRGVVGVQSKIDSACAHYGYHILTISVLADYLVRYCGGNISGVEKLTSLPVESPQGLKLQVLLGAYWKKLTSSERLIMTRLSFLRYPLPEEAILTILTTESRRFFRVRRASTENDISMVLVNLSNSALLSYRHQEDRAFYIIHPLVSDYFYNCVSNKKHVHSIVCHGLEFYCATLSGQVVPITITLELVHQSTATRNYEKAFNYLRKIGAGLFDQGKYPLLAEEIYPLAKAIIGRQWKKSPHAFKMVALDVTGDLARILGNTSLSLDCYSELIRNMPTLHYLDRSDTLLKMGFVQYERGNYADAISLSLEALQNNLKANTFPGALFNIGESPRPRVRNVSLYHILAAESCCAQGHLDQAEKELDWVLEITGRIRDYAAEGIECYHRADIYFLSGNLEKAKSYYSNSIGILKWGQGTSNLKNTHYLHILIRLGDCARLENDIPNAEEYYRQAFALAEEMANRYSLCEVLLSQARLKLHIKDFGLAITLADRSIEYASDSSYNALLAEGILIKAKVLLLQGNTQGSTGLAAQANQILAIAHNYWIKKELQELQTDLKVPS
jgi:tetratricopeptide (TPR) repeat protein